MRGKRSIALVLCLMMVLALLPVNVALAAGASAIINGTAKISELANNTAELPILVSNTTGGPITIVSVTVTKNDQILSVTDYDAAPIGATGASSLISFGVSNTAQPMDYPINLTVTFSNGDTSLLAFDFKKISAASGGSVSGGSTSESSYPEGLNAILILSPTDANGKVVAAPSGNYGDRINVRVPIFNRGGIGSRATRILVTPVLSATVDSFPFDVEAVDYTRGLDEMRPGEIREVSYNLKLSKEATSGVKEVKFNAVYFNTEKQAYETATFSVFVTVVKGKTPPKTGEEGEELTSAPKVIIEGYSVKPAKAEDGETLYAGEQFALTMRFRNTADEAVQNVQMTLDNEAGMILPANNGSNTFYIDRIGAGEVVERTMQMQTVPEIEAKSHKLSIKMSYESAKTLKAYEIPADISLSIKQRIRMRIDDPVMETDAILGNTVYVYFNIYNMGNSTVRNILVSVEGEGLRMEETYYGGNMASGGSTSADFGIIPSVAGEIQGVIVITYEDAMNEAFRVEKPFTLNVTEGGDMSGMMIDPKTGMPIDTQTGMPIDMNSGAVSMVDGMPVGGGMPLWLIAVIAVAGAGVVAGVILVIRKVRRKKFLEGR